MSTPNNFHPTGPDGNVSVCIRKDGKNSWRVAVWGDDDFGLEKSGMTIDIAYNEFRMINDGITIEELRFRKFVNA